MYSALNQMSSVGIAVADPIWKERGGLGFMPNNLCCLQSTQQ